jgi:hypothetical protein
VGAVAAYGGVLADVLARAGSTAGYLAPAAALGTLLLVVAVVWGRGLHAALFVGGATYVAFVVSVERHQVDATAPLVAVLLLLCGELAAWSVDERRRIEADASLVWRRSAAVGALALAGLTAAALVVAVSAVPPGRSLALTVAGAAAAIGAAGIGIVVARR